MLIPDPIMQNTSQVSQDSESAFKHSEMKNIRQIKPAVIQKSAENWKVLQPFYFEFAINTRQSSSDNIPSKCLKNSLSLYIKQKITAVKNEVSAIIEDITLKLAPAFLEQNAMQVVLIVEST
ncbi:UNKNOWN [Stylonychia lemnae]|uniref:Uncharacterized protein n=1 Tax=Stylonychia lemnae TaxID=5949 RepID=A0A078A8I7_STYLE|nr:UNKNOWN [Stylonychia lemnae]|eukprot:CDW77101.1 UNKNOWN [Stylonychia lemnae]